MAGDVNTVAGIAPNVTTVAGISANVTTVAGVAANVTTVAGISSNVTTVAGISSSVVSVASVASDIPTVAANVSDISNFADVYQGAKSTPPTLRNDGSALQVGDLYFNSVSNAMFVYASTGWVPAGSSVNGTSRRFRYIATAGQTTFTGTDSNGNTMAYDAGFVDVYLNGVRLDQTDYTASSGTSIVLASAAALNDELNIVAFGTFSVASINGVDIINATVSANKLASGAAVSNIGYTPVNKAGDTMTGRLTIGAGSDRAIDLLNSSSVAQGYIGVEGAFGSAPTNSLRLRGEGGVVLGAGGTAHLISDSSGRIRMPLQPKAYVEYGAVSVSAGTYTDMTGGTSPVNIGSIYNSANGRYTAPVAGVYRLTMGSQGKTAANINAGSLYFIVNGAGAMGQTLFYGDAYSGGHSDFLISLSAGDWVQVQTFGNNGVSYTHNGVRATFELIG